MTVMPNPRHRVRRLLLVGASAAALLPLAAPDVALPATTHWTHSTAKVRLPKVGARKIIKNSVTIPRRLDGYYAYIQVLKHGTASRKVRQGDPLVLTDRHGKSKAAITLKTRYDYLSGRLAVSLAIDNIAWKDYRAKSALIRVKVTVGYKS